MEDYTDLKKSELNSIGDAPKLMTHFQLVSTGLREAINDDGIFKPLNVFDVLN